MQIICLRLLQYHENTWIQLGEIWTVDISGGGEEGGGAQRCSLPLKLLGVPSMPMSKKHKRTMMGFSPMSEVGRPQTS